jgi:hypothetical protein
VNSRETDNIDEQFKKQTKNMSNTDLKKNYRRAHSRDTHNMNEQFKKKTKNMTNTCVAHIFRLLLELFINVVCVS